MSAYALSILEKSDLPEKIKQDFFHAVAVSLPLYRCITRVLAKCMEEKLDGNFTRMLYAVLNKFL